MRRLAFIVAFVLSVSPAWAGVPDQKISSGLPEMSRWIAFARIVHGRWETRARTLRANPDGARAQYWNCVNDAWFVAYSPMFLGKESPCLELARAAHRTEDDSPTPAAIIERYRNLFTHSGGVSDYSGFSDCAAAAFDYHDARLFETCSLALRPREKVLSTLTDEERFTTWMGACKRILLSDVRPIETEDGEGIKTPRKALSEFEKTQGRHCFRTLPALYEVRGMKKLSDYWTPEEQRLLYLRSKQLGQN